MTCAFYDAIVYLVFLNISNMKDTKKQANSRNQTTANWEELTVEEMQAIAAGGLEINANAKLPLAPKGYHYEPNAFEPGKGLILVPDGAVI